WQKGSHSLNIGGLFANYTLWQENQQIVPRLGFEVITGDPALGVFSDTANFPGASTAAIANARRLYAILTGRVSQILGNARLDEAAKYNYLGLGVQRARQQQVGLWLQDSWHMGPNL